jgi:hypothetical protein
MKRIIYFTFLLILSVAAGSCKKFLRLDPPTDLSGNNYWQTKADVENFTNGLYELFREAVFRKDMTASPGVDEFPFFAWGADMRGAPVLANSGGVKRDYITYLSNNDITTVVNSLPNGYSNYFNAKRFTLWDRFYKVIAAANIAYSRIDGVPDPTLSSSDKARYKGEAAFVRNITFFFLVRLYGDIPYYTKPNNTEPLTRMKMVDVLKKCVDDLKQTKDGLPWTYDNTAQRAVRAMRGSSLILLMHIDMWLASFDETNATAYYQEVDKFGDELKNQNGGAYELLPLSRSHEIFKGRSKEGLFEIPQNVNYGESFGYSAFSDNVLYAPYKNKAITTSYLSYKKDFMEKLYPPGNADNRKQAWFDVRYMYDAGNTFLMLKFTNVFANQNAEDANPDDNQTVFRLPDAYLLQAEALANLGNDAKATTLVNIVRARAGADDITTKGSDLKDDIFYERCRELMGEGLYWYDVVRTRRIISNDYKFGYHCSVEQYKSGCWTWPIDKSALINNPGMTLNNYWQ